MIERLDQPRTVRVMIVDDHSVYREGLAQSLRESGIEVVDTEPNAELALTAVEETAPDVVILDLRLPGISSQEATRRMKESARVLVLSAAADHDEVAALIAAGAAGYLPKDRPVEEIISWVRAVAEGEMVISPRIAKALLRQLDDEEGGEGSTPALTNDELEVLGLFADGQRIEEVAETLGIHASTVCTITASILMKLQRF
jgi:two-component system nitrate/nitrite response regulator NarL